MFDRPVGNCPSLGCQFLVPVDVIFLLERQTFLHTLARGRIAFGFDKRTDFGAEGVFLWRVGDLHQVVPMGWLFQC